MKHALDCHVGGYCDGCGVTFSVKHALDCHVGGLVAQHHNEVRDAIGDLSALVWNQVQLFVSYL